MWLVFGFVDEQRALRSDTALKGVFSTREDALEVVTNRFSDGSYECVHIMHLLEDKSATLEEYWFNYKGSVINIFRSKMSPKGVWTDLD